MSFTVEKPAPAVSLDAVRLSNAVTLHWEQPAMFVSALTRFGV